MSDFSEESIGLCLSEDRTKLTISDETGEARSNKSVSVDSLSLTKISAANTGIFTSEQQPVLITLPLEEDDPIKVFERPPNFLLMSHHNTSTSGVTPSATTLEGTLDDIPDFQEMLPLTSVIVTKKDQEVPEMSPETSPAKDSHHNLSLSPPSAIPINVGLKEKFFTSESKFMQEVKRQNTTKPTSSIKSFASTTGPKTSTSGITVVEVKPPLRPDDRVAENYMDKHSNPHHSIGSIKSDTTRNISASVSCTSLSSRLSEMTVFQAFNPDWSLRDKPFLLQMPKEEEFDKNDKYHSQENSRKILGDLKTSSNNKRVKPVKNWDTLEIRSRSGSPKTSSLSEKSMSSSSRGKTSKKRNEKRVINYMNESGIKQIVKEEMTAVVSMQNEIWHKILDSFVDKALKNGGEHLHDKSPPSKSPSNELVMLQLPNEEPEVFYKPLSIPIVKSKNSTKGPVLLNLPTEDDGMDETLVSANVSDKSESDHSTKAKELVQKVLHSDASIQTHHPIEKLAQFVEVGIQSDVEVKEKVRNTHGNENLPIKTNFMKPPSENLEYQKAVNKQEIPYKVMEECKMLLESIQNSANELKEINRDSCKEPRKVLKEDSCANIIFQADEKPGPYIKSKHEIFLEKFFDADSNKKEKKASKFLDIIDLPQGTSYSGHFDILRSSSTIGKPSEFIHSIDVVDPKTDQSIEKRLKVKKHSNVGQRKKPNQKAKRKNSTKSGKVENGLRTKDVFAPKKEIPRSPTPHSQASSHPNQPESPHELIPQCPPSPGEVSEFKSRSLSSIGKYLSQKDDEELSISNKTIDNVDELISKSDETESQVSSKQFNIIHHPKYQSSPDNNAVRSTHRKSNEDSNSSSEPHKPNAINPSQFSQFIEDNISKMKQAYNESQQKEADRTKKISMLLLNRDSKQNAVKPKLEVTKPTPVRLSSRLKSETVTLIKPPQIMMESRPVHPEEPLPLRQSSKVSVLSSDTSLPTNTEELLRAALDSDNTLPPDTKPTKLPAEKPQKRAVQKRPAHNHDKVELEKWMQDKRKARMLDFKKERDQKIKRESRPYKQPKSQPTPQRSEFDRKAAVLRRLNMAEELFNDIQKTPKPVVKKTGQVQDKTTEWVQGLNIEEFDSIHSQTFTSEHGASEITAGISLP
ncbi:hypothetical protein ACHWQZ_G008577 [Mnemiopsis leidyi]